MQQEAYTEALVKELLLYGQENRKIDTVFIGGGTPSVLAPKQITEILKGAETAFRISEDAEITLETNPGTLDSEKLSAYRWAGINRLSIGCQSMDEKLLAFMGRVHTKEDFMKNYRAARNAGFDNINVDLMFGIPGQTVDIWKDTLLQILELEPEHISFYSLQLEEGTEFCRMYRRGEMDLPPWEEDRKMYHEGIRMLREAGYIHYEISNCAKLGYKCRHNLKYWSFDEYLAAGLGAHSFRYDCGRRQNVSSLHRYIKMIEKGQLPQEFCREQEVLSDYMGEYIFTGLRKQEGVCLEDFEKTFGTDFFRVYEDVIPVLLDYEKQGMVTLEDGFFSLTEQGIDQSNEIMAEFV